MRSSAIIVALTLAASLAHADKNNGFVGRLFAPKHTFEAGLMLGGVFPSAVHEMYDSAMIEQESLNGGALDLGLRLSYLPMPIGGIEFEGTLAPTGTESGGGAMLNGFRGQLIVQYPFLVTPFVVGGIGSMGISSDDDVQGNDRDFVSHLGVGAKYDIKDWLVARVDARQTIGPRARSQGYTTHYELLAGIAGSWDLGGKKEKKRALPLDTDGDGVFDTEDQCPKLPGIPPMGCPVGDSDKDGIVDHVDQCPMEAEDMDSFEDEDGCPDLDNDKDGIPDTDDKCPLESETLNGVEDTDGCPEDVNDSDKDGVADALDKCKDEPEDKDGHEDTDGCPDPDNDGDGVMDDRDGCPDVAGVAENNGCPDVDTDSDGVPDRIDNCPNTPGSAENFGCKKKQLVKISGEKIEILEKVFFATGKSKIKDRSFKLLNNIASVLKAHPEIKKIRVEGHTDTVGSAATNKRLSQKRAEAVVKYLEEKGVDSSRLEPAGLGQEKPIAPNTTRRGRASNRRVEFNIISESK